jgi:hypothetical protein
MASQRDDDGPERKESAGALAQLGRIGLVLLMGVYYGGARAASGHAAAPPSSVMKSRRPMQAVI